MGNLVKIGVRFDGDPFGLGDTFYLHSRFVGERAILYLVRPHGRDLVVAFAGGGLARGLVALGPEAQLAAVMAPLAEMFGSGLRRRFAAWQVTDWRADPLARGSYSVARPGMAHARAALRQPFSERVRYAGEAAAEDGWQATVAGAYLSGRRAAREVVGSLAHPGSGRR
jgi:monoamine oxidase